MIAGAASIPIIGTVSSPQVCPQIAVAMHGDCECSGILSIIGNHTVLVKFYDYRTIINITCSGQCYLVYLVCHNFDVTAVLFESRRIDIFLTKFIKNYNGRAEASKKQK